MDNNFLKNNNGNGNYFIENLQLLLIGLKLAKIIDFSWWIVLSPIIISGIAIIILSIILALTYKKFL